MKYSFIDTHTHLYTEEFQADREEVIQRAKEAGSECLLLPNIDEASISEMLLTCKKHPDLCFPMLGLHPTELPADVEKTLQRMEHLLEEENHPFVAIGEIGIDLYWDTSRKEEQIAAFCRQIEWAIRYKLPVAIHTRAAHREIVDTLRPYAAQLTSGVFHCFGGTAEEAHELLEAFPQFGLGIGGVVTFKKSSLGEVLSSTVPLQRVVVETDAPYLSPTPHRGKRNEPAYIPLILQKLAEIYGIPTEEVARITSLNAHRIFPKLP